MRPSIQGAVTHAAFKPDSSVVPFRLNFMLFSEKNHVKTHKN